MHFHRKVRIDWKLIPCTDCERCKIYRIHCVNVTIMSSSFFTFIKMVGCLKSLRKTFLDKDTLIKLKIISEDKSIIKFSPQCVQLHLKIESYMFKQ